MSIGLFSDERAGLRLLRLPLRKPARMFADRGIGGPSGSFFTKSAASAISSAAHISCSVASPRPLSRFFAIVPEMSAFPCGT